MDRRSFLGSGLGAGFYAALLSDAKAAGTSRAPKLKIREVRAIRLKNDLHPFHGPRNILLDHLLNEPLGLTPAGRIAGIKRPILRVEQPSDRSAEAVAQIRWVQAGSPPRRMMEPFAIRLSYYGSVQFGRNVIPGRYDGLFVEALDPGEQKCPLW